MGIKERVRKVLPMVETPVDLRLRSAEAQSLVAVMAIREASMLDISCCVRVWSVLLLQLLSQGRLLSITISRHLRTPFYLFGPGILRRASHGDFQTRKSAPTPRHPALADQVAGISLRQRGNLSATKSPDRIAEDLDEARGVLWQGSAPAMIGYPQLELAVETDDVEAPNLRTVEAKRKAKWPPARTSNRMQACT